MTEKTPDTTGFEEREDAIVDLQGNWWYQESSTASWYIWNGKTWQKIPGAAPRIVPYTRAPRPKKNLPWSCLLTLFTGCLLGLIIVGGVTLVAFNFYPSYHIIPGQGDIYQIAIMIGAGLLMVVMGLFMINRSFSAVLALKSTDGDSKEMSREKKGCSSIINSLGQLLFGLFFLTGGLGLISVAFYQDVLPWLGY